MANHERPVNIRRNINNWGDPYIQTADPGEVKVCSECKAVFHGQRWYLREQAPAEALKHDEVSFTVCPACQKIRDRDPGGIVHLSGAFLREHKDEILNLIRNENDQAMAVNPLERIMDIEKADTGIDVLTTNEKLAQRVGRAIHKAYDGEIKYRWSEDNKLVRVSWQRD
jgi:NMD protein affecting ribosome stability and mRNA decay